MRRARAILPWTIAALATGASCQGLLGIHSRAQDAAVDGSAAHDAAAEDSSQDGVPKTDAASDAVDGALDTSAAEDAGRDLADGTGQGGSGGSGSGGAGGAAGRDAEDAGSTSDAGSGDAAADAHTDAGATGGSDGASSSDASDAASGGTGGVGGTLSCAPPWNAKAVEARVFDPATVAMTACSMAGGDVPALAAGLDTANFRGAQACGACLRVQGSLTTGSVVVQVVERTSSAGVILTRAAMDKISPGADLVQVDWQLVPCDTANQPVRFYIKEGSNSGYVGVQVRNARYPLASVAAVGTTTSVPLTLQSYNYWESTKAGGGPLTLKLTDINGQILQEAGIPVVPMTETTGKTQFPLCQ